MAGTKVNFWIVVVFLSLIFSYGILQFGQGLLASQDISLSSSSTSYLEKYNNSFTSRGLDEAINNPDFEENATNPLGADSDSRNIFQDVFALWNKVVNILEAPVNFIVLVYKLPSFLVEGIGLDLNEWQFVLNTLVWLMVISVIITLVRLAK